MIWTVCRSNSNQKTTDRYEEEIKNKILEAALPFVTELGWSKEAISAGARAMGYPGVTHGMFTKGGADLVHYFQKSSNLKLVEFLQKVKKGGGGILVLFEAGSL